MRVDDTWRRSECFASIDVAQSVDGFDLARNVRDAIDFGDTVRAVSNHRCNDVSVVVDSVGDGTGHCFVRGA